jgi:hypothetical protein
MSNLYRINQKFLSNLFKLIKLQRAIKRFLSVKTSKRTHRPNQSSIRLKANRLSLSNLVLNDEGSINFNIDKVLNDLEKRYVENYRLGNVVYTGEMVGDIRHGKGAQIWDDGAKYEGYWKNNKACGNGTFYHIDGDIYQGQWDNDQANGYGTYLHADGAQYQGNWVNDMQDGYGK